VAKAVSRLREPSHLLEEPSAGELSDGRVQGFSCHGPFRFADSCEQAEAELDSVQGDGPRSKGALEARPNLRLI